MKKTINIFSPIRTGSTVIHNILRDLLCSMKCNPFYKITKGHHSFNKVYNNNDFYVITIRHPYNSITYPVF